ncbi:MAG: hypothetical protein ACK5KU_06665 [Beutenbergiaceae bacterium]
MTQGGASFGAYIVVVLLLGLVVVGVGVGIYFLVKRARYVRALRDRGWRFDSRPSPEVAHGLTIPPFGVGLRRGTDEHIAGRTQAGIPFQVFEYQQVGDANVACLRLPLPLPELVVTAADQTRRGIVAQPQPHLGTGATVFCDDDAFARQFLSVAGSAIDAFAVRYPLNLAIDGDQLTQVGAPTEPEELAAYLETLAPIVVAAQAASAALEPFAQPQVPQRLGFYRRPTWYYQQRNDELLQHVEHTRNGNNHQARDVIRGEFYPGAQFIALSHHWQTQRVQTVTGPNGQVSSRTVTEHHEEVIHELLLSFHSPELTITNDSRLRRFLTGPSIDFESAEFNRLFDVYCPVPKFAYDVLHPRQIEYLLALRPPPFTMAGNRIRLTPSQHCVEQLDAELAAIAGFLARIPDFAWQELQHPRPFSLDERGVAVLAG